MPRQPIVRFIRTADTSDPTRSVGYCHNVDIERREPFRPATSARPLFPGASLPGLSMPDESWAGLLTSLSQPRSLENHLTSIP
jgi:hypothetical protein